MEKQIMEKIRKLLALSEDAKKQGSLAEAANAAAKVQDLLMKHNLSMAEINRDKPSSVDETMINILKKAWNHRHGKWVFHLYKVIAKANLCDIYVHLTKGRERIFIVGEEKNREIVEYMADQIIARLYAMQQYAWRVYKGPEKQGTFRRGYFLGATVAITAKLKESFDKGVRDTPQAQSLVHLKDQAIQDFLAKKYLKKNRTAIRITGQDGFKTGQRDGKDMSISKGLNKNPINQSLIDS